jgi:hypothetical protein
MEHLQARLNNENRAYNAPISPLGFQANEVVLKLEFQHQHADTPFCI